MRVLIVHRKGLFTFEGGEQDQVRSIAAALGKLNVIVTLADAVPADISAFDIVHFFGLDACHVAGIRQAKGLPRVLTPVFWDRAQGQLMDDLYDEWPRPGREFQDRLTYQFRRLSGLQNRRIALTVRGQYCRNLAHYASFQQVIDEIELFLPNSEAEMEMLRLCYVISDPRYRVVHNAVDVSFLDDVSDHAQRDLPLDGRFVVCSGGIDRRKNQYILLKAMLDIDVPIVFVGCVRDPRYYQVMLRLAARRPKTYFTGHLSKPELYGFLRAAAVHALPSYHDTPGIANLEAVAHECVNVGTQIGGLREYLGDYSLYANPFSVEHIRRTVLRALQMTPSLDAAQMVRENFTYENAAAATHNAYLSLLSEGSFRGNNNP